MSTLGLLLAEIRYRKLSFALSLLAIAVAVTLFVAGPILVDGYGRQTAAQLAALEREVQASARRVAESEAAAATELAKLEDQTRVIMRDMGFNLTLIARDNDVLDYLASRVPTVDMPREYVDRLAGDRRLTLVTHLVATLCGKVQWKGRAVRLVGYLPEATQSHMSRKAPMGYQIEPGSVMLGHRLAELVGQEQAIDLSGKRLRVAGRLGEQGTEDDVSLVVHLADAQAILGKPGRINQILALECQCAEADLPKIRRQLAEILPETLVLRDAPKAVARARQRESVAQRHQQIVQQQQADLAGRKRTLAETAARRGTIQRTMEALASVLTLLVVVFSALWVGLLALGNVRERRMEIGVLRAIGKGSALIAGLFLGRAALVGLLGAMIGTALGVGLARWLGVATLGLEPEQMTPTTGLLLGAIAGAPLLAASACYLPTLWGLRQDPSVVLREA